MEKIHSEILSFIRGYLNNEVNINYTSSLSLEVLNDLFDCFKAIDEKELIQVKVNNNSIVNDRNIIILCTYELQLLIEFDNHFNITSKELTVLKPEKEVLSLFLCDTIDDETRTIIYTKPANKSKYIIGFDPAVSYVHINKMI